VKYLAEWLFWFDAYFSRLLEDGDGDVGMGCNEMDKNRISFCGG
jgi:hypothetical protein